VKSFFRDNGLSLTLLTCFVALWLGQAVAGFHEHNDDARTHGGTTITFQHYLRTDHFWEATFENWESEFLQMAAYVVLTVFLFQRGSAESKDPDEPNENSASRRKPYANPLLKFLHEHSLSLMLVLLFLVSFTGHAIAGAGHYNEEQLEHGQPAISIAQYMGSSRFWFESFQNWQSEFLAVAAIVILSIWLREKGSPESKSMNSSNDETGR
jgi:membrane protein implicated in regulation of membrane protease activity